tara:strand:+ start:20103 stop:21269 length:1167 start_codon:yes stop_codon:yes gene_type:complete
MRLSQVVIERLTASRTAGLYPYNMPLERVNRTHVRLNRDILLMASSYDYLSLIGDPRIEQATIEAIRDHGTSTGGVRLLTGSTPAHRALEARLAAQYGTEDCVTFSSGYFANIGAMACWGAPNTLAHVDILSHRSVLDACTLAGSPIRRFRHNSAEDLRRRLARAGDQSGIVFIESLYSMDGDLAEISDIDQVASDAGAPLLVDDAHGLGILDPPRDHHVTAWVGALSKAVPSNGGFVATDAENADRIRHLAGPYIFSAAAVPGAVAAAHTALAVIAEEPWRRERLRSNVRHLVVSLGHGFAFHDTRAPIVPVRYTSDEQTLRAAQSLREAGLFVTPIVSPAVGPNQPRLRICVNTAHRLEDLSRLAEAILKFDRAERIDRHSLSQTA